MPDTRTMLTRYNIHMRFVLLSIVMLLMACSSKPEKPEGMSILPECGWLPNCVNTQSDDGEKKSHPIKANTVQWGKLKTWMSKQQDWEITINEKNFVQAVVKTPVMRFRDDIQLLYLSDKQLIHVRSSSRIGISDMGVNADRVETLRNLVNK